MIARQFARNRRRLQVRLQNGPLTFTSDISVGGCSVALARAILPGTSVAGEIRVDDEVFPFTGCVAWARAGEPRLRQLAKIGIRFTGIANAFFERCFTAQAA